MIIRKKAFPAGEALERRKGLVCRMDGSRGMRLQGVDVNVNLNVKASTGISVNE